MRLQNEEYAKFSLEAIVLYDVIRDRKRLSVKNKWLDEKGRVFVYLTIEESCLLLRCKVSKVCRVFKELEQAGMIERVRQGKNKPSKIYVL